MPSHRHHPEPVESCPPPHIPFLWSPFYARPQNCGKQLLASSRPSVWLSEPKNSAPTERIFTKCWYKRVFRKSVENIHVSLQYDKNSGHFAWRPIYIYFWSYLTHSFLEWEMFQTKVVEKIKKHILYSIRFFFLNRAFCETMRKHTVLTSKLRMTIWCMRIACWTAKDADIHSEYVILIALPLQQWVHERVSMLRYASIACLVHIKLPSSPSPLHAVL